MANQFSEQQRKSILLCFQLLDADSDGRLSREEVCVLIREMHCVSSEQQIEKLISEIDSDGNGTIQPSEFLSLMAKMMLSITVEKDILESFGIMAELDEQNRRVITFESLRAVMGKMDSKLSDEDIRNMIEQADEDGDGRITLEQFKKLMNR